MAYITSADISDLIVKRFFTANDSRCAGWLARVDAEIDSIARTFDIQPADVVQPYHPRIIDYARAYVGEIVCWDNRYQHNNETLEDLYTKAYGEYRDLCAQLKGQLTRAVFEQSTSEVTGPELVGSSVLWRA